MSAKINYCVAPAAAGHRFHITQTVPVQTAAPLAFYLPVWIPGSYMRRDFSRFLSDLSVCDDRGNPLPVHTENPSRWYVEPPENCTSITISYRIYGRDVSVRGCYLDHQRGFFNPCCACLAVDGLENLPHQLHFILNEKQQNWLVFGKNDDEDAGKDHFLFDDYAHLVDSPLMFAEKVNMGEFKTGDVLHQIVITGASWPYNLVRLTEDVQKICATAVDLFGALPPIDQYQFLLFLTQNTYGGLEHRASSMLMSPRRCLPQNDVMDERYMQLLGLFSHEYFHTWNIKDMKPRTFQPYDLQKEQPTTLLWLFEGFTAFFDNWLLLRSGVISVENYLHLLSQDINRHYARIGRKKQTLAQSSFCAWTKLYNGGEDAINTSTHYYIHGSLFAFCLDIFLREHSQNAVHLPRVMGILWKNYRQSGIGLTEADFVQTVSELLPENAVDAFQDFMRRYLHATEELPLETSAQYLGLNIQPRTDANSNQAGFRWQKTPAGYEVQWLNEDSPAAAGGLAVGDILVAIDNNQVDDELLQRLFFGCKAGTHHVLHVFRDHILHKIDMKLMVAQPEQWALTFVETDDAIIHARQKNWFYG